ncbi:ABC-type transport auxiliary lipoprotein family protein [Pseudomonas panipatensis]|uniref:Cholesterol transport system auxiliary component n=1 Tax=Pseudomonas panipatensis TaxID=428992 RepID=A0A1G8BXB5_9PSED|nr:ABC-type transport auxiliary lipoprotein family protein [Pseudomonas panipatensis]SDH37851.1 cholesterol transport system auxiliary component [Pseudomonas panipatensis]SMP66890.1 cholesterol transport system auxiliary component [Pseudomonas panipatensis]
MKATLRLLGCCALAAQLGACSILPKTEAPDIYRLPASQQPAAASPAVDWSLRVNAPKASQALDSNRIAVLPSGDLLSVYKGARWSDSAPALLRDRLLDAFRADGRIQGLSSDAVNLQADLELGGDLRAFQSEYRNGHVETVITLEARLVRSANQRILATRHFEVRQPATDDKLPQVISAFGQAADRLAAQVVGWTLQQGQMQTLQRQALQP